MGKKTFKIFKNNYIFILIYELILNIFLGILLSFYIGPIIGFCSLFLLAVILYFPIKYSLFKKDYILIYNNGVVLSILCSLGISLISWHFIYKGFNAVFSFVSILLIIVLFFVLFPFILFIYSIITLKINSKSDYEPLKIKLFYCIPIVAFYIFCFIIQPLDILLHNIDEIPVSFIDTIYSMLFFAPLLFVVIYIFCILSLNVLKIFSSFFAAINIGAYIQLLFFNKYLGMLVGGKYIWRDNPIYTIINIVVWVLCLISSFIMFYNIKTKYIFIYINMSIIIILFVSLSSLIISAPKGFLTKRIEKDFYYLDGSEQFTVGSEENVIFLIADAVDNNFVKEIYKDDPGFFEDFKDFTLYTNTCSVYDWTAFSVPQMLYSYTQKSGTEKVAPFMGRFTDKGYRFLFYSHAVISTPGNPERYISNYRYIEDASSVMKLNKDNVRKNYLRVVSYELLPCILKNYSNSDKVYFDTCLEFPTDEKYLYKHSNNEFENSLNLSYNQYSDKCFIYQHIDGAHFPCDDCVYETKNCLNIYKKYVNQLKEMGVYDNSVIIIAADHGAHDNEEGFPYPTASTPMFIVKGKNESNKEIQISNKPMYYQDIQATVLKYSGLYEPGDYELFGKSIDDIGENELRKRVWFDSNRGYEPRKYTYIGDTSELERVVNENIYEDVDGFVFDFNEIDDK